MKNNIRININTTDSDKTIEEWLECLADCEDVSSEDLEKIKEKSDSHDAELNEQIDANYYLITIYNKEGEDICSFEVYTEHCNYVNLIECNLD